MRSTRKVGFGRSVMLPVVLCCAVLVGACGSGQDDMETNESTESEREEFAFSGTVQSVDTTTKIVSVANDDIPVWMMAMTMSYYVEPEDVLGSLESGDRITATVYAGDFQHLYEVEVQDP